MASYIQRRWYAQLWFVLLAFGVISLPLASANTKSASALISLATRLVPLGPAAEVPTALPAHLPDLTAAAKLFFGRPSAVAVKPVPHNCLPLLAAPHDFSSGALEIFRTRAPPAT